MHSYSELRGGWMAGQRCRRYKAPRSPMDIMTAISMPVTPNRDGFARARCRIPPGVSGVWARLLVMVRLFTSCLLGLLVLAPWDRRATRLSGPQRGHGSPGCLGDGGAVAVAAAGTGGNLVYGGRGGV